MANWKITTGYSVRYENISSSGGYISGFFTIPSSANEQTAPTGVLYVAKWGNDTTGNGSRDRPYLTISKGMAGSSALRLLVIGTGVYRESCAVTNTNAFANIFVADGNVTIDGTGINHLLSNSQGGYNFVGLKIKNFLNIGTGLYYTLYFANCIISDIGGIVENRSLASTNNIYYNINQFLNNTIYGGSAPASFSRYLMSNTFVNIKFLIFSQITNPWALVYNIYKNCNIQYQANTYADYSLYHNCNFRFNASLGTQPASLPESSSNTYVPSGWMTTRPTTVAAIQAGQIAAGFAGVGFANSLITDPLFNNVALGDFTLQPNSPARNLAYEGTFVGAKSVGTPLKFRLIEANGDWQNSAATNLTIIDDSATLTTDSTAIIESNVIDLGKDKVLRAISLLGLLGDRNGEWVDSSTDLDSVTTASGSNLLIANQSYIVETGTVTYNGVLYQVGQKFAVISGTLDYTPTGGGVVRKIIEAPNRVCYEMRISSISSSDCSLATYHKYEFEVQPTVNKVGNVSSGAITLGNGEITFSRTPANVFLVSAQWIQIRLNVQNNNLV